MSTSRTREKADKLTYTQTEVTAKDTAARAGRKNLIINGAMQVAQRATSVTGVGNGDNGFHTCDRWQYVESGDTGSVFTLTQSTDAPSGFGNSMKFDCTTAESTLAANEQLRLRYKFEGQDLQQLKKGTSEAESFTLSFWVKSHTTGAAAVCFYAANRQISALYTINSSATWEKKTITFSGDSTTAIPNDANDGFQLWFQLFAGSQYTSGTLPTSWATYNENNNAVGQVLNIASSTDNYFQVTGVQLELGSGTDFEHRSYGEELALCQRYYQESWYFFEGDSGYSSSGGSFTPSSLPLTTSLRASPSLTTVLIQKSAGATFNSVNYFGTSGINAVKHVLNLATGYQYYQAKLKLDAEL